VVHELEDRMVERVDVYRLSHGFQLEAGATVEGERESRNEQ